MTHYILPTPPHEAAHALLKRLPSRRMRDVLEKRFGLKGGKKHTLEAIGKEYKITRERVRQIEADALSHLKKHKDAEEFTSVFQALERHLNDHGKVMAANHFFATAAEARHHRHVALLLNTGTPFFYLPETDDIAERWTVHPDTARQAEQVIAGVVAGLKELNHPVSREVLDAMVGENARNVLGDTPALPVREAYLNMSRLIQKNPYGEYGLINWFSISPRGIKDKAYLALAKQGKAMHFREVASAINAAGWSSRKAHPQTVHNELIKDSRFVLVGRGLYALQEWGYEPGVVRDVLTSVLKRAGRPLLKEEVIRGVLEKRFVKEPTILLNLQNRSLFKKLDDGRYTLV